MNSAEEVSSRRLVVEDRRVVHFVFEDCLSLVLFEVDLPEQVDLFSAAFKDKLAVWADVT